MIGHVRNRKTPAGGPHDADRADQSACCLLSLASELRNMIYELLLIHDIREPPHLHQRHSKHRICPYILRTCRQIHAEATPILYGENVFVAHPNLLTTLPSLPLSKLPPSSSSSQATLPPVIYPRVANMIRKFTFHVRLDIDVRYTRDQATACFSGLEVLEIEVWQPSYGMCDLAALKLLEGVRGVARAGVRGSVGDGKYARWLEMTMMSCGELGAGLSPFCVQEAALGGEKVSDYWDLDG